ncbi:unnamed protein product [Alopecurus aequalis]
MASPKLALVFFLAAAAVLVLSLASTAEVVYCRDSLAGLQACNGFMLEGTPAALPACCDAYAAAFNADPFCLCYIANGVYGRSTGYDVNVTRALEIPTSCGQVQPPIQLCQMPDLKLPLYEPESPQASSPPPASAWSVEPPRSSPARDATSPPPPPTSHGGHDSSVQMAVVLFTVAAAMVAAPGDML